MAKCTVATCSKDSVAKGFCHNHYYRFRKHGDANTSKQVQFHGLTVSERFFKYVKKTDDCWVWVGGKNKGYGQMMVDGTPMLAHRLSWLIHNGPIPESKYALHKCDNTECVNPEHLYIGDQFENMADMWDRNRANPGKSLGEKHGMSKLTEDQVKEIRLSTLGIKDLADKFNVSDTTVRDIKNRKIWRHIPD